MPTKCDMEIGCDDVLVDHDDGRRDANKIRISQSKVMEAFGGKSFYWPGNDGDDSTSDDEVSVESFAQKAISHQGDSSLTSVSTLTTVSGRTGMSERNFPRRAKVKAAVPVVDVDCPEHECGTVVTTDSITANHHVVHNYVMNVGDRPARNTLGSILPKPKKKKTPTGSNGKVSTQKPATGTKMKRSKLSKTVVSPQRKARVVESVPTLHVLPDGNIGQWMQFLEGGGYGVTGEEKERVKMFVKEKHRNTAFVSEAVKFHFLVREMRKNLAVDSARDAWTKVLPPKSADNFDFCCLFLMVAAPNTPDEKIIEVFDPLMKQNHVTPEWVLEQGVQGIADALRVLRRQHMTAKYIVAIAENWRGLSRNYRSLMDFPGVGAKVALVTIGECFNLAQGVPCDVHMVRIFKALGWMPITLDEDCLVDMENDKRGKKDDEYELARASVEGWFPPIFWSELNQTYAGLGQLLRIDESRKSILNFVDKEARTWNSKWWLTDLRAIRSLVKAYNS